MIIINTIIKATSEIIVVASYNLLKIDLLAKKIGLRLSSHLLLD